MQNKSAALNNEFNERVTTKVREVFLDLLPADVFSEMVNKEVSAFFEEDAEFSILHGEPQSFGRSRTESKITSKVTPFRLIVWESVNTMVREKIDEHLKSDKFRVDVTYNEFGQQQVDELNAFLDKKLEDFALRMAKNMFKDMFAAAVGQAQVSAQAEVGQALASRGY